jgi:hypothetical protein
MPLEKTDMAARKQEGETMVRHIVAWNYADGLTSEENKKNAADIKRELENLKNLIEGVVSIQVLTAPLVSSESDIMLDCVFEDEEALKKYQVHPEHVRVGINFVKPFTKNRKCIDFMME